MYQTIEEKDISFTIQIKKKKCQWLAITSIISCICITIILSFALISSGILYYNYFVYEAPNYKVEFYGNEQDCREGKNILEASIKETYSCKKGFSVLCDRRKNVLTSTQFEFSNCTGKSWVVGTTELTKCVGAVFLYSKFLCFY